MTFNPATDGIGITEVCRRLGISRATVYRRAYLRRYAIQVSDGRTVWNPRDIEVYLNACPRGVRRVGKRVAIRRKAKAA